jgi:hypothetical protein
MKCRQMLRCTAIYTWQCFASAKHVTAKTRNNYVPRFVFYRKKRLPITKKRFFIIKNENAQHCFELTSVKSILLSH